MDNSNPKIRITGGMLRIGRLDAEHYHYAHDPEVLIERLQNSDERIDIFTFVQGLPETEPKFAYPMEWDNLAVLRVTSFEDWWIKQIGSKKKNRARQAEKKGVVICEVPFDEKLARGIWEIYNESPIRQGRRFRHYGKDPETVYREAATYLDHSTFIGAYLGEELIGFIKMVTAEEGVQAGVMNILSKLEHRDKAPTNALLAGAVKCCAEKKIAYLVYGHYAYGNKQHDGLSDFKEKNGFRRVEVPRYYVALTQLGKVALRAGLHHRLVDHIPEPVAQRLRAFRKSWYARRIQTPTKAT